MNEQTPENDASAAAPIVEETIQTASLIEISPHIIASQSESNYAPLSELLNLFSEQNDKNKLIKVTFISFIDIEVSIYKKNSILFIMSGTDPHVILRHSILQNSSNYHSPSLYRFHIDILKGGDNIVNPKLYLDYGEGFREENSFGLVPSTNKSGTYHCYFRPFSQRFELRFDPSVKGGEFILAGIGLEKVTSVSRLKSVFSKVRRKIRTARTPKAIVALIVSSLRRDGVRGTWRKLISVQGQMHTSVDAAQSFRPRIVEIRPSGRGISRKHRIAVHIHAFYVELLDELFDIISNIRHEFDLYISTDTEDKRHTIQEILYRRKVEKVKIADIRVCLNAGRDLGPFFTEFVEVLKEYQSILHIHTKRSPHNSALAGWRSYLLNSLAGSPVIVDTIVGYIQSDPDIGLLYPEIYYPVHPYMRMGGNEHHLRSLLVRLGADDDVGRVSMSEFPAGGMFWCTGKFLKSIKKIRLTSGDFDAENGQVDATLAHALERLLPTIATINDLRAEQYALIGQSRERVVGTQEIEGNLPPTEILVFDHNIGGGTNVFSNQLEDRFRKDGRSCSRVWWDTTYSHYIIHRMDKGRDNFTSGNSESFLSDLLLNLRPKTILINSLFSFQDKEEIITSIKRFKEEFDVQITTYFHDFYALCPSQHLLNFKNEYCGVPADLTVCADCSRLNGNFHDYDLVDFSMEHWRQTMQNLMTISDKLLFFDESGVEIAKKGLTIDDKKIVVSPHIYDPHLGAVSIDYSGSMHIGLIGAFNHAKGIDIANALAEHVRLEREATQMTLVGFPTSHLDPLIASTGRYEVSDLPSLVKRSGINVFFLSSVVPETYCFTLDELTSMHVPILAFDVGAQGNRLRSYKRGRLIPLGTSVDEIYKELKILCGEMYEQ